MLITIQKATEEQEQIVHPIKFSELGLRIEGEAGELVLTGKCLFYAMEVLTGYEFGKIVLITDVEKAPCSLACYVPMGEDPEDPDDMEAKWMYYDVEFNKRELMVLDELGLIDLDLLYPGYTGLRYEKSCFAV